MKLKISSVLKFSIKIFVTFAIPIGVTILFYTHEFIPILIAIYALIIALFKDNLIRFFLPPKIVLISSSSESHFVPIPIWEPRKQFYSETQHWLQIELENQGLSTAKNVKVIFNGKESNIIRNIRSYKSLFLKPSWLKDEIEISSLPRNTSLNLDLLFISSRRENFINFSFVKTPVTFLDIECEKEKMSFIEFELIALSDNSKAEKNIFRIEYYGKLESGLRVSNKI